MQIRFDSTLFQADVLADPCISQLAAAKNVGPGEVVPS